MLHSPKRFHHRLLTCILPIIFSACVAGPSPNSGPPPGSGSTAIPEGFSQDQVASYITRVDFLGGTPDAVIAAISSSEEKTIEEALQDVRNNKDFTATKIGDARSVMIVLYGQIKTGSRLEVSFNGQTLATYIIDPNVPTNPLLLVEDTSGWLTGSGVLALTLDSTEIISQKIDFDGGVLK